MVSRGLLWVIKEVYITPTTQKIPRVLVVLCQKLGICFPFLPHLCKLLAPSGLAQGKSSTSPLYHYHLLMKCSPPTLWFNGLSNTQFIRVIFDYMSVWWPMVKHQLVLEFKIRKEVAAKRIVMKGNLSSQDFKHCIQLLTFPEMKREKKYAFTLVNGQWLMFCLNVWEHGKDVDAKQVIRKSEEGVWM